MTIPKYTISKWSKTGGWHWAGLYTPTERERKAFPVSYPAGSDGPFYKNANCGPTGYAKRKDCEAAAIKAMADPSQAWLK